MRRPIAVLAAALALGAIAPAAQAVRVPKGLPSGLQIGTESPPGDAAALAGRAPFRYRYVYVTGGTAPGKGWKADTPDGTGLTSYLQESIAQGITPVLTYYQLQPSAPAGGDEVSRERRVFASKGRMRDYWRDVRTLLARVHDVAPAKVIVHVEPDGWEFADQLGGASVPVQVAGSGDADLRGLPDTVAGFAQAFVRLRDRLAPNALLAWHLSAFGVGQVDPPSEDNQRQIATLRAQLYRDLGARFDLAFTDTPGADGYDEASFARHLALLRTFTGLTGLAAMDWQVPVGHVHENRVDWFLAPGAAAKRHRAQLKAAGVIGLLFGPYAATQTSERSDGGLLDRLTKRYYALGGGRASG